MPWAGHAARCASQVSETFLVASQAVFADDG